MKTPLLFGVLADGHIRVYEIWLSVTCVSSPILSYVALQQGAPYWSIYVVLFVVHTAVIGLLFWQVKVLCHMRYHDVWSKLVKAGLLFSSSNQYLQDARAYTCHEIIAEQAESAGEERGEQVARGQAEGRFPGQ